MATRFRTRNIQFLNRPRLLSFFKCIHFYNLFGFFKLLYREIFLKPGFHAVCYIGTMPRLVQIETWFFGIIHCIKNYKKKIISGHADFRQKLAGYAKLTLPLPKPYTLTLHLLTFRSYLCNSPYQFFTIPKPTLTVHI